MSLEMVAKSLIFSTLLSLLLKEDLVSHLIYAFQPLIMHRLILYLLSPLALMSLTPFFLEIHLGTILCTRRTLNRTCETVSILCSSRIVYAVSSISKLFYEFFIIL